MPDTPTHDPSATEPEVPDADMTRGDLVFALEHLQFERWNSTVAIRIDRGVARFLADALRRNHAARPVR
jgi:hypothetical protein